MTQNDAPAATTSSSDPVEAIVRAAESALNVRRRYQFFVWTQSYLGRLIPHQLAVCGSYDRSARELLFDVFNSFGLEPALMDALGDARSLLMRHLQVCWLEARCRPTVVTTAELTRDERDDLWRTVREVMALVMRAHGAAGCKLGVQDGRDAGQSVAHVHVHVLPTK